MSSTFPFRWRGLRRTVPGFAFATILCGWMARRALAPLRIASAIGLGRPVAQAELTRDARQREGQLVVRPARWRSRRLLISAGTTPHSIDKGLEQQFRFSPGSRAILERLRNALHALGGAAYGKPADIDASALDAVLADSLEAMRQLRRRSIWPMGSARTQTATAQVRVQSLSEARL